MGSSVTEHRRGAVRPWMVAVALAVLVLAGTALPAHAAVPSRIRFVAHAAATSRQNRVTSLTAGFGAPSRAGSLLVLAIANGTGCDNGVGTVSDNGGNLWQRASGVCLPDAFPNLEVWYAAGAASATSVTASWTLAAHSMMDVYEFAGIVSSAPLDVVSTNSGHGDTFGSSSPAVPGAGNELAVGALSGDVIQPITVTSAGFHNVPQLSAGSALTLRSGAKGLSSIASVAYEGTWSSPMDWVGIVAIFRGA